MPVSPVEKLEKFSHGYTNKIGASCSPWPSMTEAIRTQGGSEGPSVQILVSFEYTVPVRSNETAFVPRMSRFDSYETVQFAV
jgi:hypothetical protein